MKTIKIKQIVISLFGLISTILISFMILGVLQKPKIQNIDFISLDTVENKLLNNSNQQVTSIENTDFSYTIVGYRYGKSNSSVIVKKGSKEFVLYEGDILENTFELISISPNEIIFKGSGELYKLENKVGK
jgi:type II secretory pathway component PulC